MGNGPVKVETRKWKIVGNKERVACFRPNRQNKKYGRVKAYPGPDRIPDKCLGKVETDLKPPKHPRESRSSPNLSPSCLSLPQPHPHRLHRARPCRPQRWRRRHHLPPRISPHRADHSGGATSTGSGGRHRSTEVCLLSPPPTTTFSPFFLPRV